MIFVTVGTHAIGFDRLIKKMDEITPNLDNEIIMQIGNTEYEPKNVKWFKFLEYDKMLACIGKSDVIICHGGAGTLLDVLGLNKMVIVVPRLKKFREVYDDHELELAESLKHSKNISIVSDIEKLENEIIKSDESALKNLESETKLVNFLKDYLGRSL